MQTLLVVEVNPDDAVHWMSPMDGSHKMIGSFQASAKAPHPGGRHVLMGDTSLVFIPETVDRSIWESIISVDGGETIPADVQ